jgi:hypothetical protein
MSSLSSVDSISAGDSAVIVSAQNDDFRAASMSVLANYIESQISTPDTKITQYSAPPATGFTATVTNDSASRWLLLTPAGAFANGTIVLPAQASCVDRQELIVSTTQAITTLTINGNGSTVNGGPTTMAANAFFTLRFDGVFKAWYRVG